MDSNTFTNIVSIVLSSSAVGGIVKWLVTIELRHLHVETQTKLEQIKTDLNYVAFQKQTTFAKLHEKRAEVIAGLYARLVAVHTATKVFVNPIELDCGVGRQQRNDEAMAAAREFSHYYAAHQIYFEEPLCELLWKFDRDMLRAWSMHGESLEPGKGGMDLPKDKEAAWEYLAHQVPPIREEIEATFRKLLGLSSSRTIVPKVE